MAVGTLPELSEEQADAFGKVEAFLADPNPSKPYFTIHGLAGSGKTVLLSHIYRAHPGAWACTLTAKAADVLRRKTGMEVDTIHSTFYSLEEEYTLSDGKQQLRFGELHRKDDLFGKIVLADEVSMIPVDMAQDMLRTGVKIIACGDPGQLPPVQGDQFFSVPDVTLRTIHRQALDSPIIRQAHWVRLGRQYNDDTDAFRVTSGLSRGEMLAADAILCWRNKTRQAVSGAVRRYRGFTAPHPMAGEPVMCLRNLKDFGIFNGAVYTLARDFKDGDFVIALNIDGRVEEIPLVKFEGMRDAIPLGERAQTSFTYAYAMTVHKAQGSEFDHVVLVDEYSMPDHRKEWLYTGITRAAKSIQVVRRSH